MEHICIQKSQKLRSCRIDYKFAEKPGGIRMFCMIAEDRLIDLGERAKSTFRDEVGHSFRIVKCQCA